MKYYLMEIIIQAHLHKPFLIFQANKDLKSNSKILIYNLQIIIGF
jgi:hypothetical protein